MPLEHFFTIPYVFWDCHTPLRGVTSPVTWSGAQKQIYRVSYQVSVGGDICDRLVSPRWSNEYVRFWARWPTYLVVRRYFCIDLAIVGHTSSATSDAAILLDAWRWTNENASSTAASSLDLRFLIRLSFSTWKNVSSIHSRVFMPMKRRRLALWINLRIL